MLFRLLMLFKLGSCMEMHLSPPPPILMLQGDQMMLNDENSGLLAPRFANQGAALSTLLKVIPIQTHCKHEFTASVATFKYTST